MHKKAEEIIADFSLFSSWEEKYEYLIELGKDMPPINPDLKSDKNLIHGCQSRVWLYCEEKNNKFYFHGDSDSLITKGLVALVVDLYSGLQKSEIIGIDYVIFEKIGLRDHLSMTRSNGLNLMLQKIINFAN